VPARSYDNSRRAARAGDTGHRILDAAIALIGAPEPELSVARIAEHAGVAVPTVYKHFPNREAIFDALEDRSLREQYKDWGGVVGYRAYRRFEAGQTRYFSHRLRRPDAA